MKSRHVKRKTRYEFAFGEAGKITAHGGQVLVDAMARRLRLWERIAGIPGLDPRKRKGSGFDPAALAAQIILALTSGGTTLADAERFGDDPVLMEAVGLEGGADQTTLGEWLRSVTAQGVEELAALNSAIAKQIIAEAKPARMRCGGKLEVFFDDSQIEVYGKKIEGARINYNGDLALSFQALWVGPVLVDALLGGFDEVAGCQRDLLAAHGDVWRDAPSHFFADSGSSAGRELMDIRDAGFTTWSVSYNKWTGPLERFAAELPESMWGEALERAAGWTEQYAWVRHMPEGMDRTQSFAVARWKREGEMLWRYAFTACEEDGGRTPAEVFARHRTKGENEHGFSYLLADLDLHHPPCLSLRANQAFYALGAIAYNLLVALKVLELPDDAQTWRPRTIIRTLLTIPAQQVLHANRRVLRLCVPAGWMRWWRLFLAEFVPKRKRGERAEENYARTDPGD